MSTSTAPTPASPAPAPTDSVPRVRSLRWWGILLLVMFVLTSAVGGSLASESSYLAVTLASHIGLALVTLGVAGYSASMVGPLYKTLPRIFSRLSALAALVAVLAGTDFYLGGQSNYALYAMIGFAVLGIVAALLMIVLGGPSGRRSPATAVQ
jgi:hypothetical protein